MRVVGAGGGVVRNALIAVGDIDGGSYALVFGLLW